MLSSIGRLDYRVCCFSFGFFVTYLVIKNRTRWALNHFPQRLIDILKTASGKIIQLNTCFVNL